MGYKLYVAVDEHNNEAIKNRAIFIDVRIVNMNRKEN